ncbi:MAG: phosphodiester glycosidase family protein [Lachnospiraceae bacterium]|nr:phosphodiester glycosidase family protein [Lachnospiraceae bacterium]
MIKSKTRIFNYEGGEIQRVQCVYPESWESLDFFNLSGDPDAFKALCDFYGFHVVAKHPAVFGRMVFFKRNDDIPIPESMGKYIDPGVEDPLLKVASAFRKCLKVKKNNSICCKDPEISDYIRKLTDLGCLRILSGKLPHTMILPVGDTLGFMSKTLRDAAFKVNASFFVMDCFDVASPYDIIGTPFGMCIKNGVMLSPPLFGREALTVTKDKEIRIAKPQITDYSLSVGNTEFIHGVNCEFLERPAKAKVTLKGKTGIAIVGRKVVAVKSSGRMDIPASGFLIRTESAHGILAGAKVTYKGCEDLLFAVQTGNSIMIDGKETEGFISGFYNIKKPWTVSYPPSLYPLNYERARAARIALGADKDGNPMLVWLEGKSKAKYISGMESTGASLSETVKICRELGMHNGVNLDGGGSAQILLNGQRELRISDRNLEDNTEHERPVPLGLCVRDP